MQLIIIVHCTMYIRLLTITILNTMYIDITKHIIIHITLQLEGTVHK